MCKKRQRVILGSDGSHHKKVAHAMPKLFKLFQGSFRDRKSVVDIALNVYGTAEHPLFVAGDICELLGSDTKNTARAIRAFNGKPLVVPR